MGRLLDSKLWLAECISLGSLVESALIVSRKVKEEIVVTWNLFLVLQILEAVYSDMQMCDV